MPGAETCPLTKATNSDFADTQSTGQINPSRTAAAAHSMRFAQSYYLPTNISRFMTYLEIHPLIDEPFVCWFRFLYITSRYPGGT